MFPGLRGQSYQITSPREHRYNCVAFAAGDDRNWWWPDEADEDYWPAGVARALRPQDDAEDAKGTKNTDNH